MDITGILPLVLGLALLAAVIYWLFIRPKKQNNITNSEQSNIASNAQTTEDIDSSEEKKLSPEELLNKAWEFLSRIAEKVLKMSSSTQHDILNIGKKLKDNGMIFTIMVDDGKSNLPKSPAKERAKKEQKGLKSSAQQKS
jgi:hypothetical protein